MPIIWEAFIGDYEKQIPYRSIGDILSAFWYYSNAHSNNDYIEKCNKIMGK